MSNETIILAQNLATVSAGSAFSYTNKTPGPGYYRQNDTERTASYDFTNFTGTVKIQASLELQPGNSDWFDVDSTVYTASSAVTTTENYSFTGNFIWIRAAYNLQSGTINRIAVDGISVTSATSVAAGGSPTSVAFANITNKPTTVAGYGIIDAVSASDLGAFEFTGSTITITDSSTVTIDQATTVTSDLTVGGDVLPQIANGGDLGSAARPWRSLYVSNNTVFLGGVPLSLEAGTNELKINNVPISQTITYADIPNVPTDISDLTDTGNLIAGGGVTSYNDLTDKPVLFSGSYNDLTNKPDLAGTYQFSVAADDSTQRLVSTDEVIKFIGTNGITTASDAEGNITISKISELISPTVPTIGGTASASEAGITYLTGGLSKWAIFTEGAFTVGEWTDVQPGWTVTDNNGFTDTIAGRGSFGAASFSITATDWPSPASGKTYVFTSPDYQLGYTDPVEITVGSNDWTFDLNGGLTFPDTTTQTTAYTGYHTGDMTGSVFADDSTLLVDGVNGSIPYSVLSGAPSFGNWTFSGSTLSENSTGDAVIQSSDFAGSKLIIRTRGPNDKDWIFDQDGDLTAPGSITVTADENATFTSSSGYGRLTGDNGAELYHESGSVFNNVTVSSSGIAIQSLDTQPGVIASSDISLETGDLGLNASSTVLLRTNYAGNTKTWLFDDTGDLTIPGDIRSDGNINIEINFADSTLRRWQFGEDGNTEFPGTISAPSVIARGIRANEGVAEGNGDSLVVAGGTGTIDGGNLSIQGGSAGTGTGGSIGIIAGFAFTSGDGGNLNLLGGAGRGDGDGGDVSISAGTVLGDSGDGGDLFLFGGNGGAAGDGGYIQLIAGSSSVTVGGNTLIAAGSGITSGGDLTLLGGSGAAGGDLIIEAGQGVNDPGNVIIRGGVGVGGYRGDLTIDAGHVEIGSEGDISININLSDSTQRTWRFGEDGDLKFPDATTQTTAFTGNAATIDITDTNGIDTNYYLTFVENRDGGEILRADIDLIFNSADNTLTAGNITTGVLKIDDGVHEQFQTKADATGVVTHDCALGHIIYHTSPDDYFTVNLTNLNLASGYATSITVVMVQGATGYGPNALQIGGVAQTINWQGGSLPAAPTANGVDVMTFSILNNSGTYTVLGQVTGFNEVA
jgi:hypothetical protein